MKSEIKLKVCGMKYAGNVRDVVRLLPDYIGFNFYPRSKRYVGDEFEIPKVPPSIMKVGVFVNAESDDILRKVKVYKLDIVQLHGDESAEYCAKLNKSIKVIKAFGIDEKFDFSVLTKYENCCDYFLFDTKSKGFGGSGIKFDWKMLAKNKVKKSFFLSGGIDLESAGEIVHLKSKLPNLFGIDVNSKFETEIAIKDVNKLNTLKEELAESH